MWSHTAALCVPWGWAFKTIPDCSEAGKEKWYILTFTMSIVWIGIISFVRSSRVLECLVNSTPPVAHRALSIRRSSSKWQLAWVAQPVSRPCSWA